MTKGRSDTINIFNSFFKKKDIFTFMGFLTMLLITYKDACEL